MSTILAADRYTTLEEVLADAKDLLPENVVEALVGDAFNRLDSTAQRASGEAIARADNLLGQTPQLYEALDAKGLAYAGLSLCGDKAHLPQAIAAYRAARAINSDAGIVKRALRLLDALIVVDSQGLLAEVRNAAAGADRE